MVTNDFDFGFSPLPTVAPPKPVFKPEPEAEPVAPPTRDAAASTSSGKVSALGLDEGTTAAGKTYKGHVDFVTAKDNVTSQKSLDGTLDRFAADFRAMPPAQRKAILADPNFRIEVEGHASNLGNATSYDNQGLSNRRADHTADYVRKYLAKEGIDVPKSVIHEGGDGTPGTPPKPIENNDQHDRRATVKITVPEVEAQKPTAPKPEVRKPEAPKPERPKPEALKPEPQAPAPQPPGAASGPPADPQPAGQPATNGPAKNVLPQILGAIAAIGQLLEALTAQPADAGKPLPEPPPRPIIIDMSPRPSLEEVERRRLEEEARKRLEEEEAKKREDILIDPRLPIAESPYKTPEPETLGGWKSPEIDPVQLPRETPGGLQSDNSWKSPVSDGG